MCWMADFLLSPERIGSRSMKPKACLNCKVRRTRCDGTRPSCRRCAKYGVFCPGFAAPSTPQSRRPLDSASDGTEGPSSDALAPGVSLSCRSRSLAHQIHYDTVTITKNLQVQESARGSMAGWLCLSQPCSLPNYPGLNVQASAMKTIDLSMASVDKRLQTFEDRAVAHEQYRTTLQGIRIGLSKRVDASDRSNIRGAIYLMALFELAVVSPCHETSWRKHLRALQVMMEEGSFPIQRHGCDGPMLQSVNASLLRLRALAPALESAFNDPDNFRDIDMHKVRGDVRKVHRSLLMARGLRDRGGRDNDDDGGHNNSIGLAINASLLSTTDFLDYSTAYLHRRRAGSWEGSTGRDTLHNLRRDLVIGIITDSTLMLERESRNTSSLRAAGREQPCGTRVEKLNMALLMVQALCMAHAQTQTDGPHQRSIQRLLAVIEGRFCLPRVVQMVSGGDGASSPTLAETIDGLILPLIGFGL